MTIPTTVTKPLLIALVTGAATTGCATKGSLSSRSVADRQTVVSIRNNNWSDMKVYLVPENGGSPVRIATVGSLTTKRIPLRRRIKMELIAQESLRFLLKPLGNPHESYTTHSVVLAPGAALRLTVANRLTFSTLVPEHR